MKRTQYRSLADYLKKTRTRQEDFAARIGRRQGYVSRVARGLIVPRPAIAQVIAREARCPLVSFIREKSIRQSTLAAANAAKSGEASL